jgi:hypothetical protein
MVTPPLPADEGLTVIGKDWNSLRLGYPISRDKQNLPRRYELEESVQGFKRS